MSEFLEIWSKYADFKGRTSVRGFWVAYVVWHCVAFASIIIPGVFAVLVLRWAPEEATNLANSISAVYCLISVVPILSLTVRRLRDAGYGPQSFWWLLLPGVGGIALFVRLLAPSKKAEELLQ